MSTFFIADLHLGHKNMAIKRGFKDNFEHDEYLIKQWNKVVKKKDKVFILGDITLETSKWYFYLDQLNGFKSVVLGNHDLPQHIPELLHYVEHVSGMVKYKQKGYPPVFLTHCPIHSQELEYRIPYNIHGHLHEYLVKLPNSKIDKRYINVSCEQINYQPVLYQDIVKNL